LALHLERAPIHEHLLRRIADQAQVARLARQRLQMQRLNHFASPRVAANWSSRAGRSQSGYSRKKKE
jgi:hypothetical protein